MGEDNIYVKNLKKFIGQKIKVKDSFGEEHCGILLAINFMHLNVILQLPDGRLRWIKNPQIGEEIMAKDNQNEKK